CLLPLQALAVRADQLPALFLIYGIHAAVAGFVLIASFTGLGVRRADGLGLLFVLGLAANLLLYLYLLPYAVPTYPALMSSAFITLLIAGAVLFSWSTRRTILVGVFVCAGFEHVGVALGRHGLPTASFVGTLSWIAIGAALAVACARPGSTSTGSRGRSRRISRPSAGGTGSRRSSPPTGSRSACRRRSRRRFTASSRKRSPTSPGTPARSACGWRSRERETSSGSRSATTASDCPWATVPTARPGSGSSASASACARSAARSRCRRARRAAPACVPARRCRARAAPPRRRAGRARSRRSPYVMRGLATLPGSELASDFFLDAASLRAALGPGSRWERGAIGRGIPERQAMLPSRLLVIELG